MVPQRYRGIHKKHLTNKIALRHFRHHTLISLPHPVPWHKPKTNNVVCCRHFLIHIQENSVFSVLDFENHSSKLDMLESLWVPTKKRMCFGAIHPIHWTPYWTRNGKLRKAVTWIIGKNLYITSQSFSNGWQTWWALKIEDLPLSFRCKTGSIFLGHSRNRLSRTYLSFLGMDAIL